MCAPLIPPATYIANVTAIAQPQVISSQSPAARKIVVLFSVRPEPGSAATAIATTPSPNAISMKVPRNSARHSPGVPPRDLRPPLRIGKIVLTILAPPRVGAPSAISSITRAGPWPDVAAGRVNGRSAEGGEGRPAGIALEGTNAGVDDAACTSSGPD